MQSSVAQLPHLLNDDCSLHVLPLLSSQGKWFTGAHYTYKSGLVPEDDMTSALKQPQLPQVAGYPPDFYVAQCDESHKGFKANVTGTTIS